MSWQEEVDALARRRQLLAEGGDPVRLERARSQNKLRIRERIALLADPDSFRPRAGLTGQPKYDDNGELVGMMGSGGVAGRCAIGGRPVVVSGQDSTVRHDAPAGEHWPRYRRRGTGRAEAFAFTQRQPLIRILDAPGASVRSYEAHGRPEVVWNTWADATARLLPIVPVVSVVAGAAAGLPAIETCLAHFGIIVRGNGQSFPGGPPVVKAALGYEVTKEDLGGADLLAPIGVVDLVANSEEEAFGLVKRVLSYLPTNVWQMPPRTEAVEPAGDAESLIEAVSREEPYRYDPYQILEAICDGGSVFEIAAQAGPSVVTAFARVDGRSVGITIRNPNSETGGAMDRIATEKVGRFIELCDTFHLPVINFVDEPGAQGFAEGGAGEMRGLVRARARLIQTVYSTRTPWISFVVGRAHGVAGSLSRRPKGLNRNYAWPSGYWCGTDAAASRLPIYPALEVFNVDDIVDPRATRALLIEFLDAAEEVIATQLGPVTSRPAFRV